MNNGLDNAVKTTPVERALTEYTNATSVGDENSLTRYITEFAEELSTMFPTSLLAAEFPRLRIALPELLKVFAIKLGFCDPSSFARNLMYLVHKYRQ